MANYVIGIEIGGTKLQLALGQGTSANFKGFWRGQISSTAGAGAIRERIREAIPELLEQSGVRRDDVAGVGIAFGGPVDTDRGVTLVSHQVDGWHNFPISDWVRQELGWAATLQNDADSAALAESRYGAGQGFNPCMYMTIGSGIGGGLIIGGRIFRGCGAGALEIGHLRPGQLPKHLPLGGETVEAIGSGFGITTRARLAIEDYHSTAAYVQSQFGTTNPQATSVDPEFQSRMEPGRRRFSTLLDLAGGDVQRVNTALIAQAAAAGDPLSLGLLSDATHAIGWAIAQAITLINPARIVVGGGVSLMGEELFFAPVRRACEQFVFPPFKGIAEIVPAQLGEEVVVHGAVAVAAAEFLDARAS
ncbi:MAG: ROK family protein [Planctomycetota bacterium]